MVKIGEQADLSGFRIDESIPTDTENRWDGQPRDNDGRFDKGSKGGKKFRISRKEKSSESPKKSDKGVEKSAESGIIKERSKKPITKITDSAIERVKKVNIKGYTEDQCLEIQRQHKELLGYSRKYNNNNEVAFVFRKGLTDRKEFVGSEDKLEFGTYLVDKGKDLIILHNHPRNSSYSLNDISLFGDKNVKTITIIKNNGDVEYINKDDNFDAYKFKVEFDRLYKKIIVNDTEEEKDKFVKTLLNKTRAGVSWSGRK